MTHVRPFAATLAAAGALAAVVLQPAPAFAHEKWFVDASEHDTDWGFFFDPASLLMVAGAVVVAVAWRLFFGRRPSPELPFLGFLGRLAPWVPRLLGVHLGVSLLALAVRGAFLAPSLSVHDLPGGDALAFVEGALGAWLISGFRLRLPAVLVVAVGPIALFSGFVSLLECIPILGIAGFLLVLPPGPDKWGAATVDPARVRFAMQLLRAGVGAGLIVLAFSEKFANPSLAHAILERNPELNVATLVGLDVGNDMFIRIAATTELLFGLLILSGAGAQLAVIAAGIPFNLTLLLFGGTELIGHLPVYGAFLALIVYGSLSSTSREVASFQVPERR